jgi:hypothetical protein
MELFLSQAIKVGLQMLVHSGFEIFFCAGFQDLDKVFMVYFAHFIFVSFSSVVT